MNYFSKPDSKLGGFHKGSGRAGFAPNIAAEGLHVHSSAGREFPISFVIVSYLASLF